MTVSHKQFIEWAGERGYDITWNSEGRYFENDETRNMYVVWYTAWYTGVAYAWEEE